jgi:hypothetical protein
MTARLLTFLVATVMLISCGDHAPQKEISSAPSPALREALTSCSQYRTEARRNDSLLQQQLEIDTAAALRAIDAFAAFADHCGFEDSTTAIYLIKTAQVARAINRLAQSKAALDRCVEEYPTFSGKPAALFLLAQLYDEPSYMNNEFEAQQLYKRVVDEFPGTPWAASASGALKYIGKTDAEIIKELKKKH